MTDYHNVGKGLRFIFNARIARIICTVLVAVPIINFFGLIGVLVCMVVNLVGLYITGKDLEGCKTAFVLSIITLIVSPLGRSVSGFPGTSLSLINSVLDLLVTYFVCRSVGEALAYSGYSDVARTGDTVWKINLVCFIISTVISVLALIPIINILAGIASFLVLIVSLVGSILYLVFLHGSYQALE